ncbi:hypothetical protein FRC01_012358 [Tulasnella sp. 417]|nr:hypothetical protein FRC01_012358 [Tulasnella sp. 417]
MTSHWTHTLKPSETGSASLLSSRGSVDSVLIEDFSDSNSGAAHSVQGQTSPRSESESSDEHEAKWTSRLAHAALRPLSKRRAKKLMVNLVSVNDKDGLGARLQRRKAARALLDLAEQEDEGTDIVSRRFTKKASRLREGIRALFKLSDEELNYRDDGAPTTTTEPTVSIRLLELIRKNTKESLLIKTVTAITRGGIEGAAAVLHFATHMEDFFARIDHALILDFGVRVVKTERSSTGKWFSGLTLLVLAIERTPSDSLGHLAGTLHVALNSAIAGIVEQATSVPTADTKKEPHPRPLPLLSLVARCCAQSEPVLNLLQFALPSPLTLTAFVHLLLNIIQEADVVQYRISMDQGFALTALAFLLQIPSVMLYIPVSELPTIRAFFVDVVLRPRALEIQEGDTPDEEDIRKWLRTKLDLGVINALSRIPEMKFEEALASALKGSLMKFNLLTTNPYEPLEVVERLLWLSNVKHNTEEVHRALVQASSCSFLTRVLTYTGGLSPQDRGIWRARGLAMTCLGNILEKMDWVQLYDHITAEMIASVVKIKLDGDTPMVQRGQAIFLLQRYTLVADSSESSEDGDPPPMSPTHLPPEPVPLTIERCDSPLSLSSAGTSPSSVDEKRTWASKLRSKAQHALSKHRAKTLFTKLVLHADKSASETTSTKRRQAAADGLLEIAHRGSDGKDIVARRLVKTARREEQTIRALLKLNDEELEPFQIWLWEDPPYPLASTATDLIELVVSRSTEGNFIRKTLPKVLNDERRGIGAVLKLVDKHPEVFSKIDPSLIFKFGARFVEQEVPLTAQWSRGVRLLVMLLDRLQQAPLEARYNIHLPLLRALLQGCTEGFLWGLKNLPYRGSVESTDRAPLLRCIFRVLREVEEDVEALDMVIPSRPFLDQLVTGLMSAFIPDDCLHNRDTLNPTTLLVLKSLAILLQSPSVRTNVGTAVVASRAGFFVDIVLQPSRRSDPIAYEPFAGDLAKVDLRPETSAFDILCSLPEPAFADALALALSQCHPQSIPLTSPPYKDYRVIESLLWLSNTRRHFWRTSVALIEGGACQYLARVLSSDDPASRASRIFWRAKGLAMTCLGNIMERMDGKELSQHIGKGIIHSATRVKDDWDAPIVQKGQAIFMLQRYTRIAHQCGVEPLYQDDNSIKSPELPGISLP